MFDETLAVLWRGRGVLAALGTVVDDEVMLIEKRGSKRRWRVVCRAVAGVALALGCAQVFGIDEACEAGTEGCTALEPCHEYCQRISDKCAATPQYEDARLECESLCPYFDRSTDGSALGNTLECRLERARSTGGELSDCPAAGRGGNGACGSNCDAYCSLMRNVCPVRYDEFDTTASNDDEGVCLATCAALADPDAEYDPRPFGELARLDGDQPTLHCRFWHLGTAAIELQQDGFSSTIHCDHAFGLRECLPVTPPAP